MNYSAWCNRQEDKLTCALARSPPTALFLLFDPILLSSLNDFYSIPPNQGLLMQ